MTSRIVSRLLPAIALAAALPAAAWAQPATGTLNITVADWLAPWDPAGGGWAVVRAGHGVGKLSIRSAEPSGQLPAGDYDLYWFQDAEHRGLPVLVAEDITIRAGQATDVRVQTGIMVEIADWVQPLGPNGRITAYGANDAELNWTTGAPMVLPAGNVDVYWDIDTTDDLPQVWLGVFDISAPFGGIGAEVRKDEEATVIRVAPGGPADLAGILAGDELLAADGRPLTQLTLTDAVALLRGPSGSSVVVSVRRQGGQPFDVTIQRSVIDSQTVVRADAGIRLVVGPALPPLGAGGRWFVTYANQDPAARVLTFAETADATLLVGHSTYDVYWQATAGAAPRLVAEDVVTNGGIVEVPIGNRTK